MIKSSTEIFNEKVNLIYEYNKKSALFVRMANTEIENNNLARAIEILNQGIKLYPDYAAAHLLLGKALSLAGNYTQALLSIKTGSDILHSSKTYDHYVKEMESVKKQRMLFQSSNRSAFANEELSPVNEPGLFENIPPAKEPEPVKDRKSSSVEKNKSVDDRLDELAREISEAKIKTDKSDVKPASYNLDSFSGGGMIISETLAKIYIAQGEYDEAIKVYEKLKLKNPGQKDYYSGRIEELRNQQDL